MAESKCPKCESTKFETKPAKPDKSRFDIAFVQCAECGTVVGVQEANNINVRLNEIEKNIVNILSQINQKVVALQFR